MNTLNSWKECVSVNWSQLYKSINRTNLYEADVFFQFRVLFRVLELISVPNQTRKSFILIKLNTLYTWKQHLSVNYSQCIKSLNWTYLYDADVFIQFLVLIRVLELISVPNHSRDSFILIKLNTLYTWKQCFSVNQSQCIKSLNWTYLYEADVFLQFRVLIRVLELISVPNHSRDSFTFIKLNTLYTWKQCFSVNQSQCIKSLNWTYPYDADVFLQFRVLIRVIELISVPNHSRDSFILIKLNTLYTWKQCFSVNQSQCIKSLNWTYLYDAYVFLQFRVLIRVLELIFVPNHSRDSFILIELYTLYTWKQCVSVNWSQCIKSLNWTYLHDADVYLQFLVLIRVIELISVPNHSRDSFILIKLNTLYTWKQCFSVNQSQCIKSLNWTFLNDADVFLQFLVLIRVIELISVPNHSRDSFILFKLNTLYTWKQCFSVNQSQCIKSLNWIYLYDADVFLQFRVLIRVLELISVPNHSRDSFILIKLNTLYTWKQCFSVNYSQCIKSLNWTYPYDADVFLQFRVLIRVIELISVPNHSRDSFILIKLNTLYTWKQCFSVNQSQCIKSLNWTYLYDAYVFLQFRVLIRVLELIFVPNHSRDSFILIELNTLYTWKQCVSVNWSQCIKSLNWTYLYDADVYLQFLVLIRVIELISVPNHSRDSFILFKLNTLYTWKQCSSVNQSQCIKSLNWTYPYDADVFLQFRLLILVIELISVPNHSRDSVILINLNNLYSWKECVSLNWIEGIRSLNWTYLYEADVFL